MKEAAAISCQAKPSENGSLRQVGFCFLFPRIADHEGHLPRLFLCISVIFVYKEKTIGREVIVEPKIGSVTEEDQEMLFSQRVGKSYFQVTP